MIAGTESGPKVASNQSSAASAGFQGIALPLRVAAHDPAHFRLARDRRSSSRWKSKKPTWPIVSPSARRSTAHTPIPSTPQKPAPVISPPPRVLAGQDPADMAHDVLVGVDGARNSRRRTGARGEAPGARSRASERGHGYAWDRGTGPAPARAYFLPRDSPPKRLLKRATWPPLSSSFWLPPVQAG